MTRFTHGFWVALVCCLLSGATCQSPVVPVIIEPKDTDKCPAACENLRRLGCDEGKPLEDGTTCEKFCLDTQKNGHPLNPTCVMSIKVCSEIGHCTQQH